MRAALNDLASPIHASDTTPHAAGLALAEIADDFGLPGATHRCVQAMTWISGEVLELFEHGERVGELQGLLFFLPGQLHHLRPIRSMQGDDHVRRVGSCQSEGDPVKRHVNVRATLASPDACA